jgi:hypothetical protein
MKKKKHKSRPVEPVVAQSSDVDQSLGEASAISDAGNGNRTPTDH